MVLLVIDTQNLITNNQLYKFDDFVNNIKLLITCARDNNVEVIYIRHDDGKGSELIKGNDGFEIYTEFAPVEGERIFDKTTNSPFKASGLLEYLNIKSEKTLILVGLQTDYCIDATVKCGFEHGFKIIVPNNANSTFNNQFLTEENSYKYYNDFIWHNRYANCISIKETIKFISTK